MVLRQSSSFYFVIVLIVSVQLCSCDLPDENRDVEVDEEKESDHDEALIQELLDAPIGNPDQDSDVSRILKILEAAEQATSTTTTTTPKPTTPKPTTTTPSPFFKTERPSKLSRFGKPDDLDEMIALLDKSFKEAQQELGSGDEDESSTNAKGNRRSDYHHHHEPNLNKLLWGTAQAVWDVSRPVLSNTKVGRKVSLAKDTLTLPLRTLGAVKHKIHDLTHHPYGYNRKLGFLGWDHGHHHRHGWDSDVVYVKYEPENSLFKSWLRYLYRSIKPVVITKLRLKRHLIKIKLRFIAKLIGLLKHVKIQKVFTAIRALTTKLQNLKHRLHSHVIILKEAGKGWGHDHHDHHYHHHHDNHGWGSDSWKPGPPPTTAAPPSQGYGPPNYQPPPPMSTYQDISYGPPAMNSYGGYQQKPWQSPRTRSAQNYGEAPQATSEEKSPIAYNQDNTYSNYQTPPDQWTMTPEQMMAEATEPKQHGSSSAEIEAPSYANFLQQFGINPANLDDMSPSTTAMTTTTTPKALAGRENVRQNVKNSESLPYLISESSTSETAKIDAPSASRM